jgi:hypothetical protein
MPSPPLVAAVVSTAVAVESDTVSGHRPNHRKDITIAARNP